jgi:hypothetical protein
MNNGRPTEDDLFIAGPFPIFQRLLRLFRNDWGVSRRTMVVLLVGWLPLTLLIVIEYAVRRQPELLTYFTDFGIHSRSFGAAALFLVSEWICLPRLHSVARQFHYGGLIPEQEEAKFLAIVASTRRLVDSVAVEVGAIALTIAFMIVSLRLLPPNVFSPWYSPHGEFGGMSWAAWWNLTISIPLLVLLLLGWLWRVLMWARFLFKVARLQLRLVPAHPDLAAGLGFLDLSLYAFAPVGFTIGVIAAGTTANQVLHHNASLAAFQKPLLALVVLVLALFVGPLLVFIPTLRREIRRGVFTYGALAHELGIRFENKWLAGQKVEPSALEVPDFSATTDLYGIVSNVTQLRTIPFNARSVLALAVITSLPLAPVALLTIPLDVILKEVAGIFF